MPVTDWTPSGLRELLESDSSSSAYFYSLPPQTQAALLTREGICSKAELQAEAADELSF